MITYNPTDSNFLTIAQSRTNNGQSDVRIILDVINNIFYSLDDNGNFNEILTTQDTTMSKDFINLTTQDLTNLNSVIVPDGDAVSGFTQASSGIVLTDNSIFTINKDGYYEILMVLQINAFVGGLAVKINNDIQLGSLMAPTIVGNQTFTYNFYYQLNAGDEIRIIWDGLGGQSTDITLDRFQVNDYVQPAVSIAIKQL